MKKIISVILVTSMVIVFACFTCFGATYSKKNVVSFETPKTTATAKLLWTKKLGTGYKNSPTPPTLVGDYIVIAAGSNLFKLKKSNGEICETATLDGSLAFATVAVTYANGKLFVPLSNGKIQAFDFETMSSLWIYTDSLGGQCLTPITYSGGYIYTGFWNGEEKDANFVCLSVKDENTKSKTESKKSTWVYKNKGGYYGASAMIEGDCAYFGSDNGSTSASEKSKLFSVNRLNGKLVSSVSLTGDLRSSPIYDSSLKKMFISSKSGYVFSVTISTSTGKFSTSSVLTYKAGGAVTGAPIVYNSRIYVGSQNGQGGYIRVLNAKTMKLIYSVEMAGYPQSSVLVSNAYEAESSKVYIYSTYNSAPGGITVIEDSPGQTKAVSSSLYSPLGDNGQFCISPIVADSDGTLYYKNDSGTVFAISRKSENVFTWIIELINAFLRSISSIFGT